MRNEECGGPCGASWCPQGDLPLGWQSRRALLPPHQPSGPLGRALCTFPNNPTTSCPPLCEEGGEVSRAGYVLSQAMGLKVRNTPALLSTAGWYKTTTPPPPSVQRTLCPTNTSRSDRIFWGPN